MPALPLRGKGEGPWFARTNSARTLMASSFFTVRDSSVSLSLGDTPDVIMIGEHTLGIL